MLWIIFGGNIWLIIMLYVFFSEKKFVQASSYLFQHNLSTTPATLTALCSGLLFTIEYPGFFMETTISAAFLGMGAGLMFGSLFNHEAAITGACSGLLAGFIAPMLGEMSGRSPLFLLFTELIFFVFLFHFFVSLRKVH
ncbi:hypothetical protein [Salibacterium aidingense]|uniref:hypothetical protein n=1 Tax=Salibacterium aidingense TaxID=384933 RepID=UPI003BCED9ED